MKKTLFISTLLVALLICFGLLLVGCNSQNNSNSNEENDTAENADLDVEKDSSSNTENNDDANDNANDNANDDANDENNTEKDSSNACAHTWTDATCSTPKTCSLCNATEGDALGHTWVDATCKAPKTCSVCEITEGSASDHNFVNGVCSICSAPDKNSDEYKYNLLKKKADGSALSCARTAVRNMLKNPSTMSVLDEEILDSDEYFRYYVKINYSAQNNVGGTVTDTAYVLVRVNPTMDGTFYYSYNKILGVKYSISESEKTEWGWGSEPDDWSLSAADNFANPTEVSIKLLLANPKQYEGQYIKVKEKLVIASNYLSDKRFYTCQSTGDGKMDLNTDNNIYVLYKMCDNVDDCIMLDADYQKITVIGMVKTYSNSTDAYIEAYEIIFE